MAAAPFSLLPEGQRLAESCVALALKMARSCDRGDPAADPEGAALLGLCRAAATFDPGRGFAFTTHAAWKVRGALSLDRRWGDHPRRGRHLAARPVNPDDPAPAPDPARSDVPDAAALALSLVDPRAAAVLRLRYLEGLTLRATADRLGLDHETVRRLQNRALAELRGHPGMADYAP